MIKLRPKVLTNLLKDHPDPCPEFSSGLFQDLTQKGKNEMLNLVQKHDNHCSLNASGISHI